MRTLLYSIYGSPIGEVVKCCKCSKEMNHFFIETPVSTCYDCFLKAVAEREQRRAEYKKQQANIVVDFPEVGDGWLL